MHYKDITPEVRIAYTGDPYSGDDIIVEQLIETVWVKKRSFNSLGDNYAYTNANTAAFKLISKRPQ